ncbi:uncharacterized protein N7529_002495 [Penicillium soppii]|uniref:uncharacterized protein n=1 Tax=Penicillium soppii TaxID=69789 RepID=UPI002546F22D|nr:uncharacterized protein N7529_002495 [Penicillium soppii]KAJ5874065.1 hypothetical protein N7529_002495 [Penicillium soppii]
MGTTYSVFKSGLLIADVHFVTLALSFIQGILQDYPYRLDSDKFYLVHPVFCVSCHHILRHQVLRPVLT